MDSFSPDTVIHGVLLNVWDHGVLITGESGTGKSECALELVSRGHRLVADDVIHVTNADKKLLGKAPERFAGLLHVRDIGILDIRKLYRNGFEPEHEIDLCMDLQLSERPSNNGSETEIAGVHIPRFVLSIGRGRNLPLLIETIVRLHQSGEPATEAELMEAHDKLISAQAG